MKSTVKYKEGHLFAMELPNGKKFLGLLTHRKGRTKLLFGYFWHVKGEEAFTLQPVRTSALTAAFFSGLGFEIGDWKLLGFLHPWNREEWPIPMLTRKDELRHCFRGITYNEHMESIGDIKITDEAAAGMPQDGLHGYISLENYLDKITTPTTS